MTMMNEFRRNVMRGTWIAALTGVLIAFTGFCGRESDVASERERLAVNPEKSAVIVAAAWPWSVRNGGLYWEGMTLALNEVNDAGGVMGRTLIIRKEDDKESVNEGRRVAQRLADDPNVVAVIGHLNSHVSIPAASIYESSGLLMLNPGSTSPELTRQSHELVFRSVNSDVEIARQLAEFAGGGGYRRLVICYVRNAYGLGLANAFEQHAEHLGLFVADRQSYDPSTHRNSAEYQRLIDQWKDMEIDALFLAGMAPQAGYLVKQARAAGLDFPILGGDALDTSELIDAAGAAAEGMIVASVFHPDNPRPEVKLFNRKFEAYFGKAPDSWAARGYEAVRLLAEAMETAGSVAPRAVANHLRGELHRFSLSGPVTFDENGDVVGRSIVMTVVRGGQFDYLPGPSADVHDAVTDIGGQGIERP
jgi:branched-chain amino acid transport system substrate-binding protein